MARFDPAAPHVLAPPAIIEKDTTRAETVIKETIALERTISTNQFELGAKFSEIKQNDFWAADRCLSFEDFLKKHNFDISSKLIMKLVGIHETSEKIGLTRDDLEKAKINKVKAIFELDSAALLTDPNTGNVEKVSDIMASMVLDAPHKTLKEIKDQVADILGKTTPEDDQLTWMNLPIRRDAKEIVQQALDLATAMSGSTVDNLTGELKDISRAAALERISADFLSDPNHAPMEPGGDYEDSVATEPEFIEFEGTLFEVGDK